MLSSSPEQQQQPFAVCVTGLGSEDRRLAMRLAREIIPHGLYQDAVDETTTHLVACAVGSAKYSRAVHFSIPIVSRSFLLACEEQGRIVPVQGHVLGCFAGLVMCGTGFTLEDEPRKRQLVASIEANGGQYSGVLEKDRTTHLICVNNSTTDGAALQSEKQRAASEWGIKMVSLQWVEACLEMGAWCSEEETDQTSSSSKKRRQMTAPSPPVPPEAAPAPSREEEIWHILSTSRKPNACLRRCFVYFVGGGAPAASVAVRHLAVFCGATIVWAFSPSLVTHCVVSSDGGVVPPVTTPSMFVVTAEFVVQCAQAEERLSETEFAWQRPRVLPLKGKLVCVSQYGMKERAEVQRLALELGGAFTERLTRFNPKVDVLVCLPPQQDQSEKRLRAAEWGVEIHDLDWLRALATTTTTTTTQRRI